MRDDPMHGDFSRFEKGPVNVLARKATPKPPFEPKISYVWLNLQTLPSKPVWLDSAVKKVRVVLIKKCCGDYFTVCLEDTLCMSLLTVPLSCLEPYKC